MHIANLCDVKWNRPPFKLTRESSGGGVDFCLRNSKGDRILTASDEVGCTGNLLGKNRPFDLTVCDSAFTEVVLCGNDKSVGTKMRLNWTF